MNVRCAFLVELLLVLILSAINTSDIKNHGSIATDVIQCNVNSGRLYSMDLQPEVLSAHTKRVSSIAFSPDGQTLATGAEEATALLWDISTRRVRDTTWT